MDKKQCCPESKIVTLNNGCLISYFKNAEYSDQGYTINIYEDQNSFIEEKPSEVKHSNHEGLNNFLQIEVLTYNF